MKHVIRLQQAKEPLLDFEEQPRPNENFRKGLSLKSLAKIQDEFDASKILCGGCSQADVPGKQRTPN